MTGIIRRYLVLSLVCHGASTAPQSYSNHFKSRVKSVTQIIQKSWVFQKSVKDQHVTLLGSSSFQISNEALSLEASDIESCRVLWALVYFKCTEPIRNRVSLLNKDFTTIPLCYSAVFVYIKTKENYILSAMVTGSNKGGSRLVKTISSLK